MDTKGKEIELGERKIIVKLWKEGKSFRKIGETVGRSHSSIQRVINNYKDTEDYLSRPRSGRPPLLTNREKRKIVQQVRKEPRLTAKKIVENVQEEFHKTISKDTVRRTLKKANYHSRVARKKPFVSEVNRQKRIAFAKKLLDKPIEFWEKVLFTDESKFCIFGIKGKQLVWRKPNTALNPENLKATVKHGGGGVMVWGCMCTKGVGRLVFITSTMDHKMYIDILKENLKPSIENLGLGPEYFFQQDNDPKHCAHNTKLWLLYNTPKQLKTPPQSPDLNPIEHLWDLLERRIRQHNITSKETLKNVMIEEWAKISSDETKKLVHSMPKRLREVIKRKGYPTSY